VGGEKFPKQHSTRCGSSIKVLCDKLKKASSREFLPLLKRSKVVEGKKAKTNEEGKKLSKLFPSHLNYLKGNSLAFFSLCAFGGRRKEEKLILNRYRNGLLKAAKTLSI
jgi:hypothetical protein